MSVYLELYISPFVKQDINRKMVFIGGPRQSGKTTLAKYLCNFSTHEQKSRYLNWDDANEFV